MSHSQVLLCSTQAPGQDDAPLTGSATRPAAGPARESNLRADVDGLCAFDTLSIQLQIHANDTLERKSLSREFDMPAQLTVMLLLEGDILVSVNGTRCHMSARHGPVGYLWLTTRPGTLVRHIQAGQRVRKVNVTLPLDDVDSIALPPELREHITLDSPRASVARWAPSPQALRFAQEILTQRGHQDSMHSLQSYIAGLSMLQQALRITHEAARPQARTIDAPLRDRDMGRAQKIRDHIQQNEACCHITPQQLAQELGMSASTLQRVFKATYGMSIMEFQRSERLKAARAMLLEGGLTVGEAGYRAGYSTVSNFSTAFQRTFGYPPSACMQR